MRINQSIAKSMAVAAVALLCAAPALGDDGLRFGDQLSCKAWLADLYQESSRREIVSELTAGTPNEEQMTVGQYLERLKRLNDQRCIRIPTWSEGRFAGHWFLATSSELQSAKDECKEHIDYRRVGSICSGYTTTKVEFSWEATTMQCRNAKETVVSREPPGQCTSDGVPL